MSDVYVVGTDMIKFGRFPDRTVPEIGAEAALLALDDAGLGIQDMQALYCGNLGEARNIGTISPSNNFAWRLGWGADWMFTKQLAANVEMAYKINDGHATINNVRVDDWNASSFGFLFGLKMFF